MKTHYGVAVRLIGFLTSAPDVGEIHDSDPLLPREEGRRLGGPRGDKSLASTRNRAPIFRLYSSYPRRYIASAIPAPRHSRNAFLAVSWYAASLLAFTATGWRKGKRKMNEHKRIAMRGWKDERNGGKNDRKPIWDDKDCIKRQRIKTWRLYNEANNKNVTKGTRMKSRGSKQDNLSCCFSKYPTFITAGKKEEKETTEQKGERDRPQRAEEERI